MQENKCGGVYIEKYTWGWSCLSLKKKLKKISAYERRIDKRMMRMKGKKWGENEEKDMMRC